MNRTISGFCAEHLKGPKWFVLLAKNTPSWTPEVYLSRENAAGRTKLFPSTIFHIKEVNSDEELPSNHWKAEE